MKLACSNNSNCKHVKLIVWRGVGANNTNLDCLLIIQKNIIKAAFMDLWNPYFEFLTFLIVAVIY